MDYKIASLYIHMNAYNWMMMDITFLTTLSFIIIAFDQIACSPF